MKEFNTLEEVKTSIEKWFKDLGFDDPERADKQYLKIISEVGEMADALCKEDLENFKSEAGDVFVTIVGYCLQTERNIKLYKATEEMLNENTNLDVVSILSSVTHSRFNNCIEWLSDLCRKQNTTLLECATIAYNKIQGRLERGELSVKNGTVIKTVN